MRVQEIKEIAKQMGLALKNLKKAELIRSIQNAEGNNDCYDTGKAATCGQDGCRWREDCA